MFSRFASAAFMGFLLLATAGAAFAGKIATIGGSPIDATLVFTTPTGTVGPTDNIPIYETLSLAADSVALKTGPTGTVLGVTSADITPWLNSTPGVNLATDSLRIVVSEAIGCGSNFTAGCVVGPPYDFVFNASPPSIIGNPNFDLEPGNSFTYLFGTFKPTGGSAPPGTYTLTTSLAVIAVNDLSLAGNPLIADIVIGSTAQQPSFTRTVVGPEPGTWSMMLAGLGMAGVALRRKRAVR